MNEGLLGLRVSNQLHNVYFWVSYIFNVCFPNQYVLNSSFYKTNFFQLIQPRVRL